MKHTVTTTIELGGKTATGFRLPETVVEQLDAGKRPRVVVTIRDHTYRSTVAVYGDEYWVPLNAANREAAGVRAGDTVEVAVERDTAERRVVVPDALEPAFDAHPDARTAFAALSYTKQRERAEAVSSAKRPETRERRIAAIIAELTDD